MGHPPMGPWGHGDPPTLGLASALEGQEEKCFAASSVSPNTLATSKTRGMAAGQ